MKPLLFSALLSALVVNICPCEASLMVFATSKDGLVVAADKLQRALESDKRVEDAVKVVKVDNNTVIANVGIESFSAGPSGDKQKCLFDTIAFLKRQFSLHPIGKGDISPFVPRIRQMGLDAYDLLRHKIGTVKNAPNILATPNVGFCYGVFHYDSVNNRYQIVVCDLKVGSIPGKPSIMAASIKPQFFSGFHLEELGDRKPLDELLKATVPSGDRLANEVRTNLLMQVPAEKVTGSQALVACKKAVKYVNRKASNRVGARVDAFLISPTGVKSMAINEGI